MKVKIVHWRVRSWGGAEYLITKVAECLGVKEVYTLKKPKSDNPFGKVSFKEVYKELDLSAKIAAKLGRAGEYFVWECFDPSKLGDFDILFTSGATTRAIITPDCIMHVNYCHSPARWLYDLYHKRINEKKIKLIYRLLLSKIREIDVIVDRRVDYYLANSPIIKRRLWKYLKRDSKILYPPLDLKKYRFEKFGDFYLHLGRIDKEKGVVEVVKAFRKSGKKLILAGGKGTAYNEVKEIIKKSNNIEYLGFTSEKEKLKLLAECKAVVFNAVNEDFGIVPVEANASGKPCITIASGFPGIFIKDGINGILHDGSVEGITQAIRKFERLKFDPDEIINKVKIFDVNNFKNNLNKYLSEFYNDFHSKIKL